VKLKESEEAPQALSMSLSRVCTHQRMISSRVTEEEHGAGKVRCVECGSVIPDPHL
jgi:DNA-directed RNA polymerase subunit N (RpoN/RPB10)